MREDRLLAYLKGACSGKEYRVSSAELEQALGITATDLRKLVNRMRRKSIPIASDQCGYYYAATAGEIYGTIRQLRSMVNGLEAAIHGLEQALDRFSMEGGDPRG